MVIDPTYAKVFVTGYSVLLAQIYLLSDGKPRVEMTEMLAAARERAVEEPSLIDDAVEILESAGKAPSKDVLAAMKSLKLQRWVYLRDTTKYSVFIDIEGKDAYAVLGLTQPVRDLLGDVGVVMRTGVLYFRGMYICDGLVADPVWLGISYRKEYASILATLKKSGHFHVG